MGTFGNGHNSLIIPIYGRSYASLLDTILLDSRIFGLAWFLLCFCFLCFLVKLYYY